MKRFLLAFMFLCAVGISAHTQTVWTTSVAANAANDPAWKLNYTDGANGAIFDNSLWIWEKPANVEFTFTGIEVRLIISTFDTTDVNQDNFPENGTANIYLDGIMVKENLNFRSDKTESGIRWTSAKLEGKEHTIRVETNGDFTRIDAIEYVSSELPTTILDDTDAGWTWTGFALDDEDAGNYGGFQHVAEFTGSTAEFNFTGRSIKFYGESWPGAASIEIFIDGVSKGTFSESIDPEGRKTLFATITGLENVNHAVKMVTDGIWGSVDYVEYSSELIVVVPDPNVTVSGDSEGETADKLVDGDLNTKWSVDFNTAWIQFAYKEAKTWNKYSLTSGNDEPTRDFKDWTLQGSEDGTTWTILDTQTGHAVWAARNSTLDFAFSNLKAYKYYKFDVTANNGDGVTQLSEIAFSFDLPEEALIFTTSGSAAPYITYNNWDSLQEDSEYKLEKTNNPIIVDGVEEGAWSESNTVVIKKALHQKKLGDNLDLSTFPQSETDLYATYKALWTTDGVYMFFDVKDDLVRYQNTEFQWENDGVEFMFAKAVGDGKIQIIIPVMVGTTHPSKPAAKAFESGSAVGSDPAYKVFGYDANNWDETLFNWAIKKTNTGYTMEVFMDKDIVTNGNSDTNYGLNKTFAGDINVDEADERQNDNDPALFIREINLGMLGNSNQEYANSNNYGTFKMVDDVTTAINTLSSSDFNVFYSTAKKQITIKSSNVVSATLYNIAGQAMSSQLINGKMSVSNIKSGVYIINAKDAFGKRVGSQKLVIF